MAPQKRKTGGRVTPAGTRPSDKPRGRAGRSHGATPAAEARAESGRYTAPSRHLQESPQWVPALMLALFAVGAILIISRYLWWDSNIPMVAGMAALLAGLFTATRWK